MDMERERIAVCTAGEDIEVHPFRRSCAMQNGFDQRGELKNALDESGEIALPVFHLFVRQAVPEDRQRDEKSVSAGNTGLKFEDRSGGKTAGIASPLECFAPHRIGSEVQAVNRGRPGWHHRIQYREILLPLFGRGRLTVRSKAGDVIAGEVHP